MRKRVFISAVSNELRRYRTLVEQSLQKREIDPEFQEIFNLTDRQIVDKLSERIRACDAMICLVGLEYGAEPAVLVPGLGRRSFTQLEYFFARRQGIPVYRLLTTHATPVNHPNTESEELRSLQSTFRDEVTRDQDWRSFDSIDQLRAEIAELCFQWESHMAPSAAYWPCKLPNLSIGSLFKGRDHMMEVLRSKLADSSALPLVLFGLGGVGKTRLALEYAQGHASSHSALLFVSADTPETLETELSALAVPEVLALPEYRSCALSEQIAAVKRWLSMNPGWLLVIDNVDTDASAKATQLILPQLRGGRVLITSRVDRWGPAVERIDVDVLDGEASTAFLLERTAKRRVRMPDEDHVAGKLADDLHGLPLGLEQAGAYIEEEAITFQEYRRRRKQNDENVLEWFDEQLMQYPRSVAVTWQTSVRQLGPQGLTLLCLCSLLGRAVVPVGLFECNVASAEFTGLVERANRNGVRTEVDGPSTFREARKQLLRYALARLEDGQKLAIHPLVQEVTANRIPADEQHLLVDALRKWFVAYAGHPDRPPQSSSKWNLLLLHAQVIDAHLKRDMPENRDFDLLDFIARAYAKRGAYSTATKYMHQSFELKTAKLGRDHKETLASQDFLVHKHWRNGDLAQALTLAQDLLLRQTQIYGTENQNVINTRHNMADIYLSKGDHQEACKQLQEVLSLYERILPADHMHTLICLNDLAIAMTYCGDSEQGKETLLRALAGHERSDTINTESGARVLANLGLALKLRQAWADALSYLKRAWAVRKEVLGADHPDTLETVSNIAELHDRLDEREEAERLYRDVLAQAERALGATHSVTLASVSGLAVLLENQGDHEAAEPLYRRVIEAKEGTPEAESPDFVIDLNNHAVYLRKMKRFDEAIDFLRRAISIENRLLPPQHPKRSHRRNNLAMVLMLSDRLDESASANSEAWQMKCTVSEGGHDMTSARILLTSIALQWLTGSDATICIGQLRTLLERPELPCLGNINPNWDAADIIDNLRIKLASDQADLLAALVESMNDRTKVTELDRFVIWCSQPPVQLDAPWRG